MNEHIYSESDWMQSLMRGEQPSDKSLREHLLLVHRSHPGFTESCALKCRDSLGRNSYELLASVVDPKRHSHILDLACGSGVLLEVCRQRCGPNSELTGVDMSPEELVLARQRNPHLENNLHVGMAQNLHFIGDDFFDVVLCHWALTLMDQVPLVFREVKRVLKKNGVFAAIVDGNPETAPGYAELHKIIYSFVRQQCPNYGGTDLGDPRVREGVSLERLAEQTFTDAEVKIEPMIFCLDATPDVLAREVAGFFYASFVVAPQEQDHMLEQLERFFTKQGKGNRCRFSLPVNKLVVCLSPDIARG